MRTIELTAEQKVEKLVTRMESIKQVLNRPDWHFNNLQKLRLARIATEVFQALGEIGIPQGR